MFLRCSNNLLQLSLLKSNIFNHLYLNSGMLDQSADNEDLKLGSKVELPFWMVPTLHAKKIITFEIPRHYKVNYR